MSDKYLINISGAIWEYKDFDEARNWLERAYQEYGDPSFDEKRSELIENLSSCAIKWATKPDLVERFFTLLAEFDPSGDCRRRTEFDRIRQKHAEQRRAEEIDECIKAQKAEEKAQKAEEDKLERLRRLEIQKENERIKAEEVERENLRKLKLQKDADAKIDEKLRDNFLLADTFFNSLPKDIISESAYKEKKRVFVREWFAKRFSERDFIHPDPEQLDAIASVNGHIQVVARAGSGKTATLVNRTVFLLEHCRVQPASILLLAFNRKAATEILRRVLTLTVAGADEAIRERIEISNKGGRKNELAKLEAEAVESVAKDSMASLPHIMTFHALANAIVRPKLAPLSGKRLSVEFQCVVDDHKKKTEYMDRIRELMMGHFREDWDRIVSGQDSQSETDFLRSLPRETLGGEHVKSFGEKLIANFLFEHDIKYTYEYAFEWDHQNYRPDFTIRHKDGEGGIVIEYFGIEGDQKYDKLSAKKRNYWIERNSIWKLLEFSNKQINIHDGGAFPKLLKRDLELAGVECRRLTEEAIWGKIKKRSIDRFTEATENFVGRCRKQSLSPSALRDLISKHVPKSKIEGDFVDLACILYDAYLGRLERTGNDDFDGLMQKAESMIREGMSKTKRSSRDVDLGSLQFVFIDEFQDFSDLFYRLICAIRLLNPKIELFCVGDDWQAINGFAGSDLKFFENFEKLIHPSRRLYVTTNYRSENSIVEIGNTLMRGLGKEAKAFKKEAGSVLLVDADQFRPTEYERGQFDENITAALVSRIANKEWGSGKDLIILSRRNTLKKIVKTNEKPSGETEEIEQFLKYFGLKIPKTLKGNIAASTTHGYKGLEKSAVIVIDAVAKSYPLVHQDWIFTQVLGDSFEKIIEEERRLFYVALTRAINKLFIVTSKRDKSPFIDKLGLGDVSQLRWEEYPPMTHEPPNFLYVMIRNQDNKGTTPTYKISGKLKAAGYRFESRESPVWIQRFPRIDASGESCEKTKEFTIEELVAKIRGETWANDADANGVEVRILDDYDKILKCIHVNERTWDDNSSREM